MTGGNGKLLTTREVAEWLDVSAKTIRAWTRHRDLDAFELPDGELRYDPSDVQEWLTAHTTRKTGK